MHAACHPAGGLLSGAEEHKVRGMSRAFTREQDDTVSPAQLGERPVSTHRNLVTREGLVAIEKNIHDLREDLARAEGEGDRERIALVSRDLRYWNARRETAEVSEPSPDETVVRFGMAVTIVDEDDREHVWRIVGEDEADTSQGLISHASPLAQAMFGKAVGETFVVNDREWEISAISI